MRVGERKPLSRHILPLTARRKLWSVPAWKVLRRRVVLGRVAWVHTPIAPIGVSDREVKALLAISVRVSRAFDEACCEIYNAWADEFLCLGVHRNIVPP